MNPLYPIAPIIAWLFTGITKFVINSLQERRLAFDKIGYGGFPSNHTSIIATIVWMIGFNYGFFSLEFSLGAAITFIIILDATSLRRQVGKHAVFINKLYLSHDVNENGLSSKRLRERIGHSPVEVIGGILFGFLWAVFIDYVGNYISCF